MGSLANPGNPVLPGVVPAETPKDSLETPSLVSSIVGLVLFLLFWMAVMISDDTEIGLPDLVAGAALVAGLAFSITGMVLGIVGMNKNTSRFPPHPASAQLITGMVMGIVGLALWIAMIILMVIGGLFVAVSEGL